jgi:hypothetical protein
LSALESPYSLSSSAIEGESNPRLTDPIKLTLGNLMPDFKVLGPTGMVDGHSRRHSLGSPGVRQVLAPLAGGSGKTADPGPLIHESRSEDVSKDAAKTPPTHLRILRRIGTDEPAATDAPGYPLPAAPHRVGTPASLLLVERATVHDRATDGPTLGKRCPFSAQGS